MSNIYSPSPSCTAKSNTSPQATAAAMTVAALKRGALASAPTIAVTKDTSSTLDAQDPRVVLVRTVVSAVLNALRSPLPDGIDAAVIQDKGLVSWNEPHVLGPGAILDTGTRAWFAETHIELYNSGSVPITAIVHSMNQRIPLDPNEGLTVSGAWAAFVVRVANGSSEPGSQLTVTVR